MIPPDIIYEETSGDMMVPEGSSAKLICKARGFPKPKGNKITLTLTLSQLLNCFRKTQSYMATGRWKRNNRTKWFTWQDKRFEFATKMTFFIEKVFWLTEKKNIFFLLFLALVVEGEMLWLSKVTRSEMGAYLCIASNAVPPSVSKRIKLQVHCKYAYNFLLVDIVYFQFSGCILKKEILFKYQHHRKFVLSISVA